MFADMELNVADLKPQSMKSYAVRAGKFITIAVSLFTEFKIACIDKPLYMITCND